MDKKGEILNECLHNNNRKRFKADTPFDNSIVPYLIMIFCATVDGFVFYSLFSRISYDSPMMLGVQISGFLFGFDVVPIFIGIQYKRLRQGLTKDKFVLVMALIVCGLAFAMNIALRIMTVDLMSPSTVSNVTSYMGTVTQENTESNIDATAIALTIFGMGIPVVTSLGSCLISFITYNPLGIKKQRIAEMIEDTRDEVRRFDAIISDYDARSIIDDLALFELPIDIRNQFICDNAEYFFNDYSREIHQVFVALCQKYGKKEGFAYLKEHPEYIRFGVKAIK